MTNRLSLYRPGLTAIAAFAALVSTPLLAQEVDPLAPSVTSTDAMTVTPEVTNSDAAVPMNDPLAAAPAAEGVARPATSNPTATKRIATRASTRTVAKTTARTATPAVTRTVAPATPIAPRVADGPIASPSDTAPIDSAPPVALPEPIPSPVAARVAPEPASSSPADDALPIAGAAGLGLVALAAAALALRRRRRGEEMVETSYSEPGFAATGPSAEPVRPQRGFDAPLRDEAPIMAWSGATSAPIAAEAVIERKAPLPAGIDESSLGRHAAAAYRGPSPDNPSLSLKKRLKRAVFFDQRERLAAAGEAVPIARTAGLPQAATRSAAAPPARTMLRGGDSLGQRPTFQPA